MASSSSINVLRRLASTKTALPSLGKRPFHSSGAKQAGHGASSGNELYSNDYLHAPHMYDITNMKQRGLKMGLLVFGSLGLGTGVPIFACRYSQKKSGML